MKVLHPLGSHGLDARASGIHQEVTGTMGPNLGIVDLDWILAANNFCNQFGLDPTSLGFTISFAMELFEKGILGPQDSRPVSFGDRDGRDNSWRILYIDMVWGTFWPKEHVWRPNDSVGERIAMRCTSKA